MRRLAKALYCYYNQTTVTWDERKRRSNIKNHGLDFAGTEGIWDNFTITREDIRQRYQEPRFATFGILGGEIVVLVFADRGDGMHVISLRRAERHETRYYFEVAKDYFREGR